MLLLNDKDIHKLDINHMKILEIIKNTLIKKSNNEYVLEKKLVTRTKDSEFYTAMPSALPTEKIIGNKIIKRFDNISVNHPKVFGYLTLEDMETGQLKCMMDATWLTTARTGASFALTAQSLASKKSETIGIMGLGNTATATLHYLSIVLPEVKKVKLLKYKDQHEKFATQFSHYNYEFIFVETIEELLNNTDIIISAISYAKDTFATPNMLKPGVLVLPIHSRGFQDCDMFFDKIYTDDYAHTKHFLKRFDGEVGSVFSKRIAGRETDEEKIIAYNIGISVLDMALAKYIYELAQINNIGIDVDFGDYTQKNIFWEVKSVEY